MRLNEYISSNNIKGKDFAETLEISQAYLSQLCSGARQPSKYLAMVIEAKTGGLVTAKSLRPDIKKIA